MRAIKKRQYKKGKIKIGARNKIYRDNNPEKIKALNKAYYIANKTALDEYKKQWGKNNSYDPVKIAARRQRYAKRHPEIMAAFASSYRAARLNATPLWVEKSAIKCLFAYSASKPTPHNVDHVIPLKNKDVCGLNCLDNLEVIPFHDNMVKNNKFDQDMESARQLTFTRQKLAAA